jgi:hypothetical protein
MGDELHSDTNPYAAPATGDGPVPLEVGVGVWREGHLIVMHESASLPPFCVKSGMPALRRAIVEIFRFELAAAPIKLAVPLAHWWRIVAVWCRYHVLLLAVGVMLPAFMLAPMLKRLTGDQMEVQIAIGAGAFYLSLFAFGIIFGSPLNCVRSHGHYIWLKGADLRFLDRLPDWNPLG